MVNLTINGTKVSVKEGTTILDAAKSIGETIPTLCYLKEINEIGACRVCVVEVEGTERCVTACNNFVEEGMVVYTNSRKVRTTRKTNVKLILSQHDYKCGTCVRSGNCTLQSLANELNISEMPYDSILEKDNWDMTFPLIRNAQKCIKCMRCVQICDNIQEMHIWDVVNTGSRTTVNVRGNQNIRETACTLCGQCVVNCPVGALRERDDVGMVLDAVEDDEVITVVQVAPAVRTAWGESFGLSKEFATAKRLVGGLRKIGFDYIFDTTFAADMTNFSCKQYEAYSGATPLGMIRNEGLSSVNLMDMLTGKIPGTIGETSVIAILIGAIILILLGVINLRIPASYIITFAIFMFIFGAQRFDITYVVAQLCGGGLMLGAFFMATDYVTSPITPMGQIVFGICCGLLTGIFRCFGANAEGVSFAIILSNLLVPLIEKVTIPRAFGVVKEAKKNE